MIPANCKYSIHCYYLFYHARLLVWGVFYLVDRFLGLSVTVGGWRIGGFESLQIKYHHLELVGMITMITCKWHNYYSRSIFCVYCRVLFDDANNVSAAMHISVVMHIHLPLTLFRSVSPACSKWMGSTYLWDGSTAHAGKSLFVS